MLADIAYQRIRGQQRRQASMFEQPAAREEQHGLALTANSASDDGIKRRLTHATAR